MPKILWREEGLGGTKGTLEKESRNPTMRFIVFDM